MLFQGNAREGGYNLALHLGNTQDNEHVHLHELKGFAGETLREAFYEAYAISKGTRCTKYLYSLSINPPEYGEVTTADFEAAIQQAEERLNLTDQPRAVVFHDKNSRRHCHVVWSRIKADEMKAVPMSNDRPKLQELSRELYIKHGWKMPMGMIDKSLRDPKNFTLSEWQQANRLGKDPRNIKTALQDAWATSDSQKSFIHALQERGYTLARGDRRGFVALDRQANPFALVKKWLGVSAKDIRQRFDDPESLPSIDEARHIIAHDMKPSMTRLQAAMEQRKATLRAKLDVQKAEIIAKQQIIRKATFSKIEQRHMNEQNMRQNRFRSGLKGAWDKIIGDTRRIQEQNMRESLQSMQRDRVQRDSLILKQLDQRQRFDLYAKKETQKLTPQRRELQRDVADYRQMRGGDFETRKAKFLEERKTSPQHQPRDGPKLTR